MIDQETLAEMALWAAKNIAFNLGFITEDKLAWKPAPESNSVLEIINHIGENFTRFNARFAGSPPSAYTPVTTAVAAKQRLLDVAHEFAQIIRQAEPEQLAQNIRVQGMNVTVKQAAATARRGLSAAQWPGAFHRWGQEPRRSAQHCRPGSAR